MNKKFRRILSALLTLTLCFSLSSSVFAASAKGNETAAQKNLIGEYTFEVSGDGTVMPLSSVSGYNQKTVTAAEGNNGISIDCNGQGVGGMGITIETSCSNGNYQMEYAGSSVIGSASNISGRIWTNDHIELKSNLWQNNLGQYFVAFGVPSGVSVFVKVWIYG